ncbi:hypothetical protein N7457_009433, partial [Penicillium paradoxum]|uniref:uncharacterized protein n=1 Tax=Penicillium paradoxum TaxID=176176 RepID=UPI0025482CE6
KLKGPKIRDVLLYKERFYKLLRRIVITARYSKSLTIYMIRKYLRSIIKGIKDFYKRGLLEELLAKIEASIL